MTHHNLTKLAGNAVIDPKIMRNAYRRVQRIKDYAKANPDTTTAIPQTGGRLGLTEARAFLRGLQDQEMPYIYYRKPGSFAKKAHLIKVAATPARFIQNDGGLLDAHYHLSKAKEMAKKYPQYFGDSVTEARANLKRIQAKDMPYQREPGSFALSPELLKRKRTLEYQGRSDADIRKALAKKKLELRAKAQAAAPHEMDNLP